MKRHIWGLAFAVLAVAAYGQVRVITAIPGIPIFTISNPRFPDYILLKNQVQYTPPLGFSYDDCVGVGTDFSFDGLQSPRLQTSSIPVAY